MGARIYYLSDTAREAKNTAVSDRSGFKSQIYRLIAEVSSPLLQLEAGNSDTPLTSGHSPMATLVNRILATRIQRFFVCTLPSSTSALPPEQSSQAHWRAVGDTGGQPPDIRSEADHMHSVKLGKSENHTTNLHAHQLNKQVLISATISMVCYSALPMAEDDSYSLSPSSFYCQALLLCLVPRDPRGRLCGHHPFFCR